jgi:hypothetical protein
MICWPVSGRACNVKNNDPSLIEPLVTRVTGPHYQQYGPYPAVAKFGR